MGSKSPLHLSALKSLNFFLSVFLGSGKGKDHNLSISQQNLEAVGGKKQLSENSQHLGWVLLLGPAELTQPLSILDWKFIQEQLSSSWLPVISKILAQICISHVSTFEISVLMGLEFLWTNVPTDNSPVVPKKQIAYGLQPILLVFLILFRCFCCPKTTANICWELKTCCRNMLWWKLTLLFRLREWEGSMPLLRSLPLMEKVTSIQHTPFVLITYEAICETDWFC